MARPLRSAILDAGSALAEGTGILALIRWLRETQAPILCYHSVLSTPNGALQAGGLHTAAEKFREQMRFLARHYTVMSLGDLVQEFRQGRNPRSAAVVTFDDGYVNTLEVAAPILAEFGCPATVFLATGFMDSADLFWWDESALLFSAGASRTVRTDGWGELSLIGPDGGRSARARADELLAAVGPEARRALLDELAAALGVPRPTSGDAGLRPLRWEECQRAPEGIQFGGHTVTHRVLDRIPDDEGLREIRQCRGDLERLGRRAVPLFCYPAGRWTPATRRALAVSGFIAGVDAQSEPGLERLADRSSDLSLLPRIGIAGGMSTDRFAVHLSGLRGLRRAPA